MNSDSARAWPSGGVRLRIRTSAAGTNAACPSPTTARAANSSTTFGLSAIAVEAIVQIATPASTNPRAPPRSARRPNRIAATP